MASTTQSPDPTGRPEQTALVVEVPAAEAVVGRWRARYDRAARAGVPAHVTVCFPFLAPDAVDEDALTELAGSVEPFTTRFATTGTFGEAVLWLAPEPAEPFRALTRAVFETFGVLPYGGAHGGPDRGVDGAVPHLTVAEHPDDPDEVGRDVTAGLPVDQEVTALTLLQGTFEDGWRVRRRFPLRGQR